MGGREKFCGATIKKNRCHLMEGFIALLRK